MSVARIWAVIVVVVPKNVVRGEPFHSTLDWGVKLPPVTVIVKPGWPANMLVGFMALRLGVG